MPGGMLWESPPPSQTPTPTNDATHRPPNIVTEASWPNVEPLSTLLGSSEFNPSHWQRVIDQKVILQLLDRFASEDAEERDILKTVLVRVYSKFLSRRAYIRKQNHNVFQRSIYEEEIFNGVAELLKVLDYNIDGFARPVKAEHKQFLIKVLNQLHKPERLENYHAQRTYYILLFFGKDATLAEQVVKGLLMFWPKICTEKLFLQKIEDILYVMEPTQFAKIKCTLFKQIANFECNPHPHVVERALYYWRNDYTLGLIEKNNQTGMPLMLNAPYRAAKEPWDQTTASLVYNALKRFMEINFKPFDRLAFVCQTEREREKKREKCETSYGSDCLCSSWNTSLDCRATLRRVVLPQLRASPFNELFLKFPNVTTATPAQE
ncbi:hypothetical protein HPB48_012015 [Haemaphysalis longicornis]|uniref:Uncharacterized protein n=1 Tax=Haemaphysalis longicornis TaxID=44386 RepID=A0A9J6GAD7_HAELO|nr:hypothetical protein HPB48_012015 [Haemaphysalis longicornis]